MGAVIEEMAGDLARMIHCWFEQNPHARLLPRAPAVLEFAGWVLEELADGDRCPAEEEAQPLCPARFASYHRGRSPMTGRARRRK